MRLLPNLGLVSALLLFSVFPALSQEDDPTVPSDGEYFDIQGCLDGVADGISNGYACIGTVSGPCLEKPDSESTVMMEACAKRELVIWDGLLNDTYGTLIDKASPEQKKALQTSQRAWISMRDKSCEYEALLWEGGSGAGLAGELCRVHITGERVVFLATIVLAQNEQ
jgi:uncharacterized protein YecT (DUF1311 family)